VWTSREEMRRHMRMRWTLRDSYTQSLKESYAAQNSLEFKISSRNSPPFYAKQVLSHPKEKNGHWVDFAQLPASPSLWLTSRIPCRSCLSDNYSEEPCTRTGPLKTGGFHLRASIYFSFLG